MPHAEEKNIYYAIYREKNIHLLCIKIPFLNNLQQCSDELQKVIRMAGKKRSGRNNQVLHKTEKLFWRSENICKLAHVDHLAMGKYFPW